MAKVQRYLTPKDDERIRRAVVEAESRTLGEIVPMIVPASDTYSHIHVTAGIAFAVTAFAVGVILWPQSHPSWFLILEFLGYILGNFLFRIDGVKRLFLSHPEMEARVFDRALRAFYEHELHKTAGATGILILTSLLERRVQILADQGINEKVGEAEWQKAVSLLTRALKENRTADGFCEAIALCGGVLARHFPAVTGKPGGNSGGSSRGKPGENPNELPDRPIQSE